MKGELVRKLLVRKILIVALGIACFEAVVASAPLLASNSSNAYGPHAAARAPHANTNTARLARLRRPANVPTCTGVGYQSFVGGGNNNFADAGEGAVLAGQNNSVCRFGISVDGVIGGGEANGISGVDDFIGGGQLNATTGDATFVGAGVYNAATANGAFVGAGDWAYFSYYDKQTLTPPGARKRRIRSGLVRGCGRSQPCNGTRVLYWRRRRGICSNRREHNV